MKTNYWLPLLALTVTAASSSVSASADELVYGTATLTYAEYYAGDVSSTEALDAVSSATKGKYNMFANEYTDFVDEETNKDGYRILGVSNVNVAVAAEDLEAFKAINDSFVELEEAPAQYKPVTIEDGAAVYGETVLNVADTVTDAALEVVTDSHWGDYQINVLEDSTAYIRNTREDTGFAIGGGIQGIIVETESGLKVGMEYMASIWVQPWEISWNVSVDNSHNTEIVYDNMAELDKLMGETVTKITFLNQDDAYVYEFDGAYIPVKFAGSLSAADAAYTDGSLAVTAEELPEDYEAAYEVSGLEAVVEDGALTWESALPGSYTVTVSDAAGVYAPMSASFTLTTDELPVSFDEETLSVVPAEGADEELAAAFIANLASVTVNDNRYNASGRGAAVIIDSEGVIDTEAVSVSGRGENAVTTEIFPESGEYSLSVESTGFTQALEFTFSLEK